MHSFITLACSCATLLSSAAALADHPSDTPPTAEVFFAFDSASIADDAASQLAGLVDWSAQHPYTKLVLDGHTDVTGTDAYNIGLSSRRATSVAAKLIALGVPADRIYRGVYGEDDVLRATHDQDRRVTIWTTDESLSALIQHSLVRGTAVLWNSPVTAAEIDGRPSTLIVAAP
jgi:hypothetical protein